MTKTQKQKIVLIAGVSAVWWILSLFTEPLVFQTALRPSVLPRYILVRLLCLGAMTLTVAYLYRLIGGLLKKDRNLAVRTTLYAVPVWILLFGYCAVRDMSLGGEELNIIEAATHYDLMNAVFTYITSYIEMIMMMMVPSTDAPQIMKILLLGLDVGYAAARTAEIYRTRFAPMVLYLGMIVPPAVRDSCSIHRCPMYGMLYFFLAAKLFCDWKEGKKLNRRDILISAALMAVLTWWRAEGIYFLALGPVLLLLTYRIRPGKRTTAGLLAAFYLLQLLVWLPKTAAPELNIENYGKHQLTPFYNYALTGMLCTGLDREKNAEDLETIEPYMHIDFIDILYDLYGEHIFDEGHATYHESYTAVNPDATEEMLDAYEAAVRHLILKNPLLFIRAQIRAFHHISAHYDGLCLSAVFGNLWLVVLWLLGILAHCVVKKKWAVLTLTLCPICHGCISTIFLPAAYFKYYYPEYLFAWLFLGFALSSVIARTVAKRKGLPQ